MTDFRIIPSVEQLRQREAMRALETRYGRTVLLDALSARALPLAALRTHSATLEDVFVSLTGRQLREE